MSDIKNIYMVGIKGVGMTSLAVYLKQRGKHVWGSDVPEVFPTDEVLHDNEIKVLSEFSKNNITSDIDLIITTGAHGGLKNEEVIEGRSKSIPVMTQAEEVGHIMKAYQTGISICGAHGKTTTSSMLAFVLRTLKKESSHVIGAPTFSGMYGGEYGGLEYFVAEADEYMNSPGIDDTPRFMFQHPQYVICTNIDFDHPDVYKDINQVKQAYKLFFTQLEETGGILIYNETNEHLSEIAQHVTRRIPFSSPSSKLELRVPGEHNMMNAQAVLSLCFELGLDEDEVLEALSQYTGSKRRFEHIDSINETYLIDDYAHHPQELKALLEGARSKYPGKRIVLLFQPHTYSRTQALKKEFVEVLSKFDKTFLLDIFGSARENMNTKISSKLLAEQADNTGANVSYVQPDSIMDDLGSEIHIGDVIITAGAGNIYKHHDVIKKLIHNL